MYYIALDVSIEILEGLIVRFNLNYVDIICIIMDYLSFNPI